MDVDWIHEFRAAPQAVKSWRGHVFLEVYLDGVVAAARRAGHAALPRLRRQRPGMLPGNRFAYDKGDDPFDLVLSCRWELWKEQTRRYFLALDPALLPWSASQDLLAAWRVWITGNRPLYRYAHGRVQRGWATTSEDASTTAGRPGCPQARGGILIVTCQGHQARPARGPAGPACCRPRRQAFARGGPPARERLPRTTDSPTAPR